MRWFQWLGSEQTGERRLSETGFHLGELPRREIVSKRAIGGDSALIAKRRLECQRVSRLGWGSQCVSGRGKLQLSAAREGELGRGLCAESGRVARCRGFG